MSGFQVLQPGAAMGIMGPSDQYSNGYVGGPSVNLILNSARYAKLDKSESYFKCTQHDYKMVDFDGRIISTGSISNPLLSSEMITSIPLRSRRPNAPYRLAKKIVKAFTNLLFGNNRSPIVNVTGSKDTEDFIRTLIKEGDLMSKMVSARDKGGSVGSVGVSWCFHNGKPRFDVHNGKHIFIEKWEDRDNLIPEHVIEMYRFSRDEWNRDTRRVEQQWFWFRRDWTPQMDIMFKEIPVQSGSNEPDWIIDEEKTVVHNDGVIHFEWIQNLPSEEVDGEPDYDGLLENFDTLDLLNSVLARGGVSNLDPTLVLKVDAAFFEKRGVKKGSDNALIIDAKENEDAKYLELSGSSLTVGMALFDKYKEQILEVAECVLPDPNVVAAQGTSSVALKVIYAPMLAKCDVLRSQYEKALKRLIVNIYTVATKRYNELEITTDDEGNVVEGQPVLNLPPRIEEITVDEMGYPLSEPQYIRVERTPGEGGEITLQWGAYFTPTPTDQQMISTSAQMACGSKPVLSHKAAVEQVAQAYNLDSTKLLREIEADREKQMNGASAMFPGDVGGMVQQRNSLPFGAQNKGNLEGNSEEEQEQIPENDDGNADLTKVREFPPNVFDDEPNLTKDAPGPRGVLWLRDTVKPTHKN